MAQEPVLRQPGEDLAAAAPSDSRSMGDLRKAGLSGIRAMVAGRLVLDVGGFASTILIARLVSPSEMGRAAVALVIPMLAVIITFEGFGSALVQRAQITRDHLRTSMALSLSLGAILAVSLSSFGLVFGRRVFDAETAELLVLISPVFILAGISTNSRCQLQRRLEFGKVQRVEIAGFVSLTVTALGLALAGAGAHALVIGALVGQTVEASLFAKSAPPVSPRYVREAAKDIAAYGGFASISGLASVVRKTAPFVVLGALADSRSTGIFYRAYQAGAENQGRITGILTRVAFPVMSRAQSLDDVRRVRAKVTSTNALVIMPLLAGFVVVAPAFIPWVYGARWADAVEPAQVLALAGAALALTSGADVMALALGYARQAMIYRVFGAAAVAIAVALFHGEGLVSVAWAVSATYFAQSLVGQLWLAGKLGGVPFKQFLADVLPAIVSSVAAYTVGTLCFRFLGPELHDALLICVCGAIVVSVYVLSLRIAFPKNFQSSKAILSGVRGRRTPKAGSE